MYKSGGICLSFVGYFIWAWDSAWTFIQIILKAHAKRHSCLMTDVSLFFSSTWCYSLLSSDKDSWVCVKRLKTADVWPVNDGLCSISPNIREGLLEAFYGVYEKDPDKVKPSNPWWVVATPTWNCSLWKCTLIIWSNDCFDVLNCWDVLHDQNSCLLVF